MYDRAVGCDVVVFSGSEAKKADAIALGATEFCMLSAKSEERAIETRLESMFCCFVGVNYLGSSSKSPSFVKD